VVDAIQAQHQTAILRERMMGIGNVARGAVYLMMATGRRPDPVSNR
jgi:hypothetical protein